MQERNQRNKSRQRYRLHRNRILLVVGCLLVTAAVAEDIAVFGFPAPARAWIDIQPDRHVVSGSLHNRESREVDRDSFWMVLNQLPTTSEGNRGRNIEYENPNSNHYSARISLYLTESGQPLGNTRRVDPGNYIEVIQMGQALEAGKYPLTVRIELFEGTAPSGTMTLEMTLRITKP